MRGFPSRVAVLQPSGIAALGQISPGDDEVSSGSDSAANKASAVDAGCAFLLVFALNLFITSPQIRIKNDSHQEFLGYKIFFFSLWGLSVPKKRSIHTFLTAETSS